MLAERHAGVVVDTAGFGNQAATVAAAAADLVLAPVSPGEADVMEAQRTVACNRSPLPLMQQRSAGLPLKPSGSSRRPSCEHPARLF
jgi:cellulose biosynthesis protein BcsQ